MRFCFVLSALLLSLHLSAPSGGAQTVPTQRDWMVNLVDTLGWSFGLPDTPKDQDYLKILERRRTFRIEAESVHHPADVVSKKSYQTFGESSGEGWLSGVAAPTVARLDYLLPLAGRYKVSLNLLLPGHQLTIGGQSYKVDGGERFTRVDVGYLDLPAGHLDMSLQLPPNGGLDYIELQAPDLPPVHPPGGWRPERPLTLDDLAVTTVQLLGLEHLLPASAQRLQQEAETAAPPTGVEIITLSHLGEPSGGQWVRAGAQPAQLQVPLEAPAAGVYALFLRGAAEAPVRLDLNGRDAGTVTFSAYLQDVPGGIFYLPKGPSTLTLSLPPRGGLDLVRLERKQSEGADYRRLVGLPASGTAPTAAQMDSLLALLSALTTPR